MLCVTGTVAPGLAMLASLGSLACSSYERPTSGERRVLDGGPDARPIVTCPTGEVCDESIRGLAFAGALPRPHVLAPIAEGGREAVLVYLELGGRAPELETPGWRGPFAATTSDPAVLATGVVIAPDVTVDATGVGTSLLRIVHPGTDALFDRISMSVAPVARSRITTVESFYAAPDADVSAVAREALEDRRGAELMFRLLDATGATLWDDSLTIEGHPLGVHNPSWGLLAPVGAEAPLALTLGLGAEDAPGPIDLRILRAAGETVRTIHVVDAESASSLRFGARQSTDARAWPAADGTLLAPGDDVIRVCAVAMRGGTVIAGAPIVLSVDESQAGSLSVDADHPACGFGVAGAPLVITATMGAWTQTVRLVASDHTPTPAPLVSPPSAPTATEGERASLR